MGSAALGGVLRGHNRWRSAEQCGHLLEEFVEHAEQEPENLSDDLTKLAQIASRIISEVSG